MRQALKEASRIMYLEIRVVLHTHILRFHVVLSEDKMLGIDMFEQRQLELRRRRPIKNPEHELSYCFTQFLRLVSKGGAECFLDGVA